MTDQTAPLRVPYAVRGIRLKYQNLLELRIYESSSMIFFKSGVRRRRRIDEKKLVDSGGTHSFFLCSKNMSGKLIHLKLERFSFYRKKFSRVPGGEIGRRGEGTESERNPGVYNTKLQRKCSILEFRHTGLNFKVPYDVKPSHHWAAGFVDITMLERRIVYHSRGQTSNEVVNFHFLEV